MKKAAVTQWILLSALAGSTLLTGCARQYTMTMQNGSQTTVIGKPRIVGNSYVSKDAHGQEVRVPVVVVREISPSSMASSKQNSGYNASPGK